MVVGSNARFDCLFQGDPHAAVLWYRNRTTKEHPNSLGTFLIATGESTKLKYKILLNHSLVIVNATHDDAGYYTCNLLRTSSNVDFQAKLYVDGKNKYLDGSMDPSFLPLIKTHIFQSESLQEFALYSNLIVPTHRIFVLMTSLLF